MHSSIQEHESSLNSNIGSDKFIHSDIHFSGTGYISYLLLTYEIFFYFIGLISQHDDPLGPPAVRPRTGMNRTNQSHDSDDEEINAESLLPI